jgi:hypothetical protein
VAAAATAATAARGSSIGVDGSASAASC